MLSSLCHGLGGRAAVVARAGLALALAVAIPAIAPAATFRVADATQLKSAISASLPGDIILLAEANYGRISISGLTRTGASVVLMPDGSAKPVASEIAISSSSGFTVIGVKVTGTRHPLVAVSSSSDISLGGLNIQGITANQDPWDDSNSGLWIRFSQRVSVSNSRISDVRTGMFSQRSTGVVIADNTIEYVREGLNVAATDQLLLRRNRFQNIMPNYALGEHPDAVQFWTNNETVGVTNAVILDNYLMLSGPRAVQGFFIEDGQNPADPDAIMHERVEVRNNIYYGSSRNALRLGGVRKGWVHHNTIVASPHADLNSTTAPTTDGRTSGGLQPFIAQYWAVDGRIEFNISPLYGTTPGDYVSVNNIKLYDSKTKTGDPYTSVFLARPTQSAPPLTAFKVLAGSVAASLGAGATPPSTVGIQVSSVSSIRSQASWYQSQTTKVGNWFTPGF
jgi:nitrous oxidase accessory protein NosD